MSKNIEHEQNHSVFFKENRAFTNFYTGFIKN